jgi:hypothetical protein
VQALGTPLVAPLTAREVCYFVVDEPRWWPIPRRRTAIQDFILRDDTGTAIVRVAGAMVATIPDPILSEIPVRRPTAQPGIGAQLNETSRRRMGMKETSRAENATEAVLATDSEVVVYGIALLEDGAGEVAQVGGDYRSPPRTRVLATRGGERIFVADARLVDSARKPHALSQS